MKADEFLAALVAQSTLMVRAGIGSFQGMPIRQRRVELVGGGGDGTMITIGILAEVKPRFTAVGRYDDGSEEERAVYVREEVKLHPEAAPAIRYRFEGVPG